MRKKRKILCLAAALMLLLCACTGKPPEPPPYSPVPLPSLPPVTDAPKHDNVLSIPYDPESPLHPYSAVSPLNRDALGLVYETLTALDEHFSAVPALAEAFESADNRIWSIRLRAASFSDGAALNAGDAVYSVNKARAENSFYAERLARIEAVEATGPMTLEIRLTEPDALFPALLNIPVIQSGDRRPRPMGTGAYEYCLTDGVLTLEKNRYAGKIGPFDRITMIPVSSPDQAIAAFGNALIDVFHKSGSDPHIMSHQNSGEIRSFPTPEMVTLIVNRERSLTGSEELMHILNSMLPRDLIARKVYLGNADSACVPLHPASPYYDDAAAGTALLTREAVDTALAEMGWTMRDGDGIRYRTSRHGRRILMEFTVVVPRGDAALCETAELCASELQRFGVRLHIERQSPFEYAKVCEKKNYDFLLRRCTMQADMDILPLLLEAPFDPEEPPEALLNARNAFLAFPAASAASYGQTLYSEAVLMPLCFLRGTLCSSLAIDVPSVPVWENLYNGFDRWSLRPQP